MVGELMPQFNASLFNAAPFGGEPVPMVNTTARGLLYIAFREARVLKRPQGLNSDNELLDGLIFLNQQLDYWSARGCYSWTTNFQSFTLTPTHQPYLIGPGLAAPDFAMSQRPVAIVSGSVILPGGGNNTTDVPINIRDNAWWAAKSVKNQTSTFPTDLYYEPDVPYGEIWFWPIAVAAYGVRLETQVQLLQFATLDDPFIAPPAYQAGITLTLAEELVDIWGTEMPLNLSRRAMKARDALQSNNNLPPRIASADWGTSSTSRGDFNYMTGTIPSK
jgi:hypothetical protein